FTHAVQIQFFHLVGLVLALGLGTHAIAFDGMRQNNGGLTFVIHRCVVSRIHLVRIVATAVETENILIAQVFNQLFQLGIHFKKVFTGVFAALGFVILIIAIHGFIHTPLQHTAAVFGEQRVPMPAPHHFNNVPAGAAELAFQLLNN